MQGPNPGIATVDTLMADIADMATHINGRFVPDADKLRLFQAAMAAADSRESCDGVAGNAPAPTTGG